MMEMLSSFQPHYSHKHGKERRKSARHFVDCTIKHRRKRTATDWIRIIYSGYLSFYNFPYAFGGLFARGLYAKYKKEGASFVPLYKKLLQATGTTTVEGAAEIAGISFWRSSLQILADEIDEFIALC